MHDVPCNLKVRGTSPNSRPMIELAKYSIHFSSRTEYNASEGSEPSEGFIADINWLTTFIAFRLTFSDRWIILCTIFLKSFVKA
jgi:hypothetical protein